MESRVLGNLHARFGGRPLLLNNFARNGGPPYLMNMVIMQVNRIWWATD